MRMSKIHKIVVAAVVTTIATATVLTFTRGDSASADRVASLPETGNDSPVVASRTPGPTKPTPTPSATTPAPRPPATTSVKPSTKTAKPSATTKPAPSPTPTPREKSLIEILLGQ